MRNPQAYATVIDPGASRFTEERDVFKCAHFGSPGCMGYVHVKPLSDPAEMGGRCTMCEDGMGRGLICKNCVGKPCSPFMKKIEAEENAARLQQLLCL